MKATQFIAYHNNKKKAPFAIDKDLSKKEVALSKLVLTPDYGKWNNL